MIIVSQDKKTRINFNNCADVHISNTIENRYDIFVVTLLGMTCKLAEYETEERAKEILKEITVAYSDFEYFKNTTKEAKNYLMDFLMKKYEQFDIYEMPKE